MPFFRQEDAKGAYLKFINKLIMVWYGNVLFDAIE